MNTWLTVHPPQKSEPDMYSHALVPQATHTSLSQMFPATPQSALIEAPHIQHLSARSESEFWRKFFQVPKKPAPTQHYLRRGTANGATKPLSQSLNYQHHPGKALPSTVPFQIYEAHYNSFHVITLTSLCSPILREQISSGNSHLCVPQCSLFIFSGLQHLFKNPLY